MRRAERIVVVVLALAAVAWLGLGLHSSRLEAEGRAVASGGGAKPDARRLADARRLLEDARRHSADINPLLLEAGLLNFAGRGREAVPVLREVVRREPENFDGWVLLAGVAQDVDPGLARRAQRRARELNPLAFPRRD